MYVCKRARACVYATHCTYDVYIYIYTYICIYLGIYRDIIYTSCLTLTIIWSLFLFILEGGTNK